MSKRFFWAAFAAGLAAVAWIALGFAGTNWIAFTMSIAIAAVFVLGGWELRQHRAQTAALDQALAHLAQPPARLDDWLAGVPQALRSAVRHRVESERGALPGPALTPYLVGLLVMLGMLGTFLGMVVTFRGAVFALQGSTDLQAIRAALAEPIKGLGLSFGTSVAGVATSALLGLMSAIARRERLDVARTLDNCIAGVLRPFSRVHQREEALRAAQAQAAALPGVVGQLEAMMERIEQRGQALDERLLASQAQFHRDATAAYSGLARDVGASLRDSIASGAQAAGASIRPVMEDAMTRIVQDTRQLHERLADAAHAQVDALSTQFGATAQGVSAQWESALQAQSRQDGERLAAWTDALQDVASGVAAELRRIGEQASTQASSAQDNTTRLLAQSEQLLQSRMDAESHWLARHGERMDHLASVWREQLDALRKDEAHRGAAAMERLDALTASWRAEMRALRDDESARGAQSAERLDALAGTWHDEMRALREEESARGAASAERLDALAGTWREEMQTWRSEEGARGEASTQQLAQLAGVWRTEMQSLRDDEARRGEAAVARLGDLQAAVAQHLATLGAALEAPLARLLQTASEVPQAASGVLVQLRAEMGRLSEQENVALQERTALIARLATLVDTIETASARAADMSAQATAGAVELASWGDAFGAGVQQFHAANEKLATALQQVEAAIGRSTTRSDEQLAYYVAQAREVIDLSIASQHGVIDKLRQLAGKPAGVLPEGHA